MDLEHIGSSQGEYLRDSAQVSRDKKRGPENRYQDTPFEAKSLKTGCFYQNIARSSKLQEL